MTIEQDRAKYFYLGTNSAVTESEPEPSTFDGSRIEPLIDLQEYVSRLLEALALVGTDPDKAKNKGDFIFIHNWFLWLVGGGVDPGLVPSGFPGPSGFPEPTAGTSHGFDLDPTATNQNLLIKVLKEKASRGVDVRVLGWVSFGVYSRYFVPIPFLGRLLDPVVNKAAQIGIAGFGKYNLLTMKSIKELRDPQDGIAAGAMLNTIAHTAGATHTKLAMVGTKADGDGVSKAVAFTGGLDFAFGRWARFKHRLEDYTWEDQLPEEKWGEGLGLWHDVQAAIEGKAAQAAYDFFRDMWNENLRRDPFTFRLDGANLLSYTEDAKKIEERDVQLPLLSPVGSLKHHVQSLRTIPRQNYLWRNCLPEGKPASFAQNGMFEVKAAWRKAILAAEKYIYIEDQAMQSREVMSWINESVRAHPDLKVILATSGGPDPFDAPDSSAAEFMSDAYNNGLLGAGDDPDRVLSMEQQSRIRAFGMWHGEPKEVIQMERANIGPVRGLVTDISPAAGGQLLLTLAFQTREDVGSDVFSMRVSPKDLPEAFADEDIWMLQTSGGAVTAAVKVVHRIATSAGQPVKFLVETLVNLGPTLLLPLMEGIVIFFEIPGIVVHSKVTIIDDKWALIGSANVMRRSLYTDWEHAVSFIDESVTNNAVQAFRTRLWEEHSLVGVIDNLQKALGVWEPAWNPSPATAADASPLTPVRRLRTIPLPVPQVDMTSDSREKRDWALDVDSRDEWGGFYPPKSLTDFSLNPFD